MTNSAKNCIDFLDALSLSLFCENTADFDTLNIPNVLSEAKVQTVFPLIYSALCGEHDLSQYQAEYYSLISNNVKVVETHKQLHKLLSDNDIPYVFLKGCASARYYPDPLLRTMGDVDILISPKDTEKVDNLFLSLGYTKHSCAENLGTHIGYKTKTGIECELHRQINGIPKTEIGDRISALFSDIFDKSVLENGEYRRPSDFHHGLILLLHTATHLTHEGIGLRHLCDWAVFVSHFTDNEFLKIFENSLKDIGLWKFAQILTQVSVKYLGCSEKSWVGTYDDSLLQDILNDILGGGNFGKKDFSRYQHIKYISDCGNNTTHDSGPIRRVFHNFTLKAKNESFVKKVPLLLPIGFISVTVKYLWLIVTGKRKLDNKQLISKAAERNNIYNKFDLFK